MNTYMYSSENNSFIPKQFVADYEKAGWDVSRMKDVSDDIYMEFRSDKKGFTRSVGDDGLPAWAPLPPPTKEELIKQAVSKKQNLMAEAREKISVLQDAVDLDMATEEEAALLMSWKKYRVLLNRVDTSIAPDIDWPQKLIDIIFKKNYLIK